MSNDTLKLATRQNPTVPIEEFIQGDFTISAPWRGSATAPDTSQDSALMTGMREDMADFLLKMPADMRRSAFSGSGAQELCKLGFEDAQLATLGIEASCGASGGNLLSIPKCKCDCHAWPLEREIHLCQKQCPDSWKLFQCEAQSALDAGAWDEETDRYVTELAALGVEGETYDNQSQAFASAAPDRRARMWVDLDILREVLTDERTPDLQQAMEQEKARSTPEFDAETLRYVSALEQAGHSPEVVDGLATVFAISSAQFRQLFWDDIKNQQP